MVQRGQTGKGYIYYRDRSRGADTTVYEHQLMALEHYAAADVFDSRTHIHHVAPTPDANVPWLLEVVEADEHRSNGGDRYSVDNDRREPISPPFGVGATPPNPTPTNPD